MNGKEYLESIGYEFPDKDFWMEDYVTDHKFKDLVELMERYAEQKINVEIVTENMPLYNAKYVCEWYSEWFKRRQENQDELFGIDETLNIHSQTFLKFYNDTYNS